MLNSLDWKRQQPISVRCIFFSFKRLVLIWIRIKIASSFIIAAQTSLSTNVVCVCVFGNNEANSGNRARIIQAPVHRRCQRLKWWWWWWWCKFTLNAPLVYNKLIYYKKACASGAINWTAHWAKGPFSYFTAIIITPSGVKRGGA